MVAATCENVENGIDSDIVDSGPSDWLQLQGNYGLDDKGVYGVYGVDDNHESTTTYVCMTFTDELDELNNKDNFNHIHVGWTK